MSSCDFVMSLFRTHFLSDGLLNASERCRSISTSLWGPWESRAHLQAQQSRQALTRSLHIRRLLPLNTAPLWWAYQAKSSSISNNYDSICRDCTGYEQISWSITVGSTIKYLSLGVKSPFNFTIVTIMQIFVWRLFDLWTEKKTVFPLLRFLPVSFLWRTMKFYTSFSNRTWASVT